MFARESVPDRFPEHSEHMAQLVFWCAALLLLHTYFFYPLILFVLDRARRVGRNVHLLKGEEHSPHPLNDSEYPSVTLVVAAYNEEGCIGQKVTNSLELDYPRTRFDLVIGSDGSTDSTDEIVKQVADPRVQLVRQERSGKVSVLNRCIPKASGEIIVLTDANTKIQADALKKLVRPFADPDIGAVCGRLKLINPTQTDYEESAYWSYESLIKFYEGKHGSVMGANGGLYAIRRRLFRRLPPSTIIDDFVIPLKIMEQGFRVVYEQEALAFEETTEDYGREFARRTRIAAGNFQSLAMFPRFLSPLAGFRSFAFWSHKVVRWSAPALMAVALAANLFLLGHPFYQLTLAAQLLFYALALAGKLNAFDGLLRRAASIAYYFVTMNFAMVVGFWRFVRGSQHPAWERTARI
jgi:cellulose synthase/poly-beta-1,6-N-acetylglucosamine synthase-like glycosyltransferase